MMKIKNGIATDSIFLTVVKLVTTLVGIFVTMILSKNLSLHEYGTYSQGNLIGTLGTSILILGLSDATNYFFSKISDYQERDKYLSTILFVELFVGFIGLIVVIALTNTFCSYFDNDYLKNIILWVAAVPMLTNFINIFQILFIALKKAKQIALKNLIVSILKIAIAVLICYLIKNIVYFFVFMLAVDILQVVYFYFSLRHIGLELKFKNIDFKLITKILKYSIPIALYIFLNAMLKDVDKFIVGGLTNTETLGLFTNVSKPLPFDILTSSFLTVMIPVITKKVINNEVEDVEHIYRSYFLIGILTTWTLGITSIIANKEMIIFLYGDLYTAGWDIFVVYVIVDLIKFFNLYLIVSSKNKGYILAITSAVTLLLNIGLDYLFFRLFGTIGVALATLLVTLLNNITIFIVSKKILKLSIINIFPKKFLLIFVAECAAVFTSLFFLGRYLEELRINSVLILIVLFAISCLTLFLLNFKNIKRALSNLNSYK